MMKLQQFLRQLKNSILLWMNNSLKRRLVILFLAFSIIPSLVITFLSYNQASQTIVQDKIIRAEQDMQLFIRLVELRLEDFEAISEDIVYQPEFKKDDFKALTRSEQLYRINQIENYILKQMNNDQMIDSVYFIGNDYNVVPSIVKNYMDYFEDDKEDYNSQVYSVGGDWVYRHKDNQFLTYKQLVYDKVTFEQIGLSVLNIRQDAIDKIYEGVLEEYVAGMIIFDNEHHVYYDYGLEDDVQHLTTLLDGNVDFESSKGLYLKNDYIMLARGEEMPFSYMIRVPVKFLYQESRTLLVSIILFLSIVIILAVIVAFNSSQQFIRPIHQMVDTITQNRNGDLSQTIPIVYDNEIGFLASNYNAMVEETNLLIQSLDKQYYEKRKAELDALQSQITPHFLYNTLNSIRCLARINKETSIEMAITSTIELLQLTISNKEVLITIEDELAIVKNYLNLYAFRMNYTIGTSIHVDPALLPFKTVKFTLQPFVENAIHHGINVQSDEARISIHIYKSDQDICFQVRDNGVGMTEQQIEDILIGNKAKHQSKFNGIGVRNVAERIKMHFGDNYGVSYKSRVDQGTKVTIRIPMVIEGGQHD